MNNFDTLFPNFLSLCAEMNRVLTPIAFVLLAVGIVSSTVTGHRSPSAYLRTIGRTFAFAAVLAYLPTWNNEIASVVDTTVKQTLRADPAGVYAQYQKALAVSKGTSGTGTGSKSWWDLLDAQSIFEHLISAALWLLGFLASVIVFYAYLVQKFILYVGFALAPIFIGFLAVRTLHSIGVAFLLGYAGVLCWPIGWGAASLLTSGLIGFMTDQSFLASGGFSRRSWIWSSKSTGPRCTSALAHLQHHRRADYHSEGYLTRHSGRTSLVRDNCNRRDSWTYCRRGSSDNIWRCRRLGWFRRWDRWGRNRRTDRSRRSFCQRQLLFASWQSDWFVR